MLSVYATDVQKDKLRSIKGVAGPVQDVARNTLVCGCQDQGAYIQFGRDLQIYNLYEALLYAESYESSGCYAEGSVKKTFDAVITCIAKKKL